MSKRGGRWGSEFLARHEFQGKALETMREQELRVGAQGVGNTGGAIRAMADKRINGVVEARRCLFICRRHRQTAWIPLSCHLGPALGSQICQVCFDRVPVFSASAGMSIVAQR